MKIFINDIPIIVGDEYIEEHANVIKEALLAKYGHIDTLARTPLRVLSQTLLNKFHDATQQEIWKNPRRKDPSIHLIESILSFVISEIKHLTINIHVVNGAISQICIKKDEIDVVTLPLLDTPITALLDTPQKE